MYHCGAYCNKHICATGSNGQEMEQETFKRRQAKILESYSRKKYQEVTWLCASLREEITDSGDPDPVYLGWIRSYHFQSLVLSGDVKGAYELYHFSDPFPFSMPQRSQHWMDQAMRKVCASLEHVDELLRFGRLDLSSRIQNSSRESVAEGALEMCEFLRELDREELNFDFVIQLFNEQGDIDPGHQQSAFSHLLRNFEKSLSETISEILLSLMPSLIDEIVSKGDLTSVQVMVDRLETLLVSDHYLRRSQENGDMRDLALAAMGTGNVDAFREAILSGAPLRWYSDGQWNSLIESALKSEESKCFHLLLRYKTDLHGSCGAWKSPIHLAASLGREAMTFALLAHGAALYRSDKQGRDVLHFAILSGNTRLVKRLLESGASTTPSGIKLSGLAAAIGGNQPEILSLLLKHGADPRLVDGGAQFLALLAIKKDVPGCLKILLSYPSGDEDIDYNYLLAIAESSGRGKCLRILKEHG